MKAICRALGASRSNYYDRAKKQSRGALRCKASDDCVLKRILEIIREKVTYGYRRGAAMLRRDQREFMMERWQLSRAIFAGVQTLSEFSVITGST